MRRRMRKMEEDEGERTDGHHTHHPSSTRRLEFDLIGGRQGKREGERERVKERVKSQRAKGRERERERLHRLMPHSTPHCPPPQALSRSHT